MPFLPRLAVLPESVLENASSMIAAIQAASGGNNGALQPVGIKDIMEQLREQPLSKEEGGAFVRWWVGEAPKHAGNTGLVKVRKELLDAAIIGLPAVNEKEGNGRMVPLGAITQFVDQRRPPGIHIPLDGPLPVGCAPQELSGAFKAEDLNAAFGWTALTLSAWLEWVCDPARMRREEQTDVTRNAEWAGRVLTVLGKAWSNSSQAEQDKCAMVLRPIACVPTSAGMKLPGDAYFPSVSLFPDLPILTLNMSRNSGVEKVLTALGVRRHVELQIVFDRMIRTAEWGVPELIKYLVSVKGAMSEAEMKKLKATAAFVAEGSTDADGEKGAKGDGQPASSGKAKRWKASQLYEPVESLRELGLPLFDWAGQKWKPGSEEGMFQVVILENEI
jgi:hypothetical protein